MAWLGWLSLLVVPASWPIVWVICASAELLVPVWAERAERTTYHPEHIAERFGLFMIIVLGESVLAASLAIQAAALPSAMALSSVMPEVSLPGPNAPTRGIVSPGPLSMMPFQAIPNEAAAAVM